MRHLSLLFFAALVSILFTDVGAWPEGCVVGLPPIESSSWLGNAVKGVGSGACSIGSSAIGGAKSLAESLIPFNTTKVTDALGAIKPDIELPDVFGKVLSEMKNKALDAANAEGFVQQMGTLAAETAFGPYVKVFKNVVKVYGMYENFKEEPGQILGDLVEKALDASLKEFTNKDNNAIAKKIAPFVTDLIKNKGDNAGGAVKDLVTTLMKDPQMYKELGEMAIGASPVGPAYNLVTGALKNAPKFM